MGSAFVRAGARGELPYRNFGAFRLFLALLVVIQHYCARLAPEDLMRLMQPYEVGSVAVLAFFALSGFVITEAVDQVYQGRPRAFLTNRLLRIAPQFLLAGLIALVMIWFLHRAGLLRVPRDEHFPGDAAFTATNLLFNFFAIFPLAERGMRFKFVEIVWAVRVEMAYYGVVFLTLALAPLLARLRGTEIRDMFAPVSLLLAVVTFPLFVLALHGRGISMFQFWPYLVFGAALYFALSRGSSVAYLVAAFAFACIDWHFLSQPVIHPGVGFRRALVTQLTMLTVLLGMIAVLAWNPGRRFEKLDKAMGELTYPLYLSHMNLIFLLLALTQGYSYGVFVMGFGLAFLLAWVSHRLVDPVVDRLRNVVRGRAL